MYVYIYIYIYVVIYIYFYYYKNSARGHEHAIFVDRNYKAMLSQFSLLKTKSKD